ncbi:MAG: ThuA domain-containing protein [Armatimonadota bacterium]
MRAFPIVITLATLAAAVWPVASAAQREIIMPSAEEISKMEQAAPDTAPAQPAKPRKVLVWGRLPAHHPVPFCRRALEIVGRKTGAFEAVVSEDDSMLLPESLRQFDALVMNNIHERQPFLPANFRELTQEQQAAAKERERKIQQSILDYVAGGKGIVGIHGAVAAMHSWQEYGEMMGGYYGGHITQDAPIKLEDPDHPVNACFGGKGFRINDEIYILREPHSRERLRILLSLDLSQMADPGKRADKDYAISWVREYGKGRVFYCSLGHVSPTYWNPLVLRHYLAGIQFALGDLKADATPSGK